jgi:hypothetical protein
MKGRYNFDVALFEHRVLHIPMNLSFTVPFYLQFLPYCWDNQLVSITGIWWNTIAIMESP